MEKMTWYFLNIVLKYYTSETDPIISFSIARQSKALSKYYFICTFKRRNDSNTVTYRTSNSPIPDISFLSKAAKDACKGISTYWMYPSCEDSNGKNSSQAKVLSN